MDAQRSRSRSPPRHHSAYSPSRAVGGGGGERDVDHRDPRDRRSPPPPPRRYDNERRDRDHWVPPPRDQRDRDGGSGGGRDNSNNSGPYAQRNAHGGQGYYPGDERGSSGGYDGRVPPPRRYDEDGQHGGYDGGRGRHDGGGRDGRDARDRDRDRDRDYYPPGPDRNRDREWDRDRRDFNNDRDRDHHNHHGGNSHASSEPSRDLILLGLDPELTETDLLGFLRAEHGANVDSAKIVRDRQSGQSKLFGFVQFGSLEDARRFMSSQGQFVTMPKLYPHSEVKRVKIDYAGNRSDNTSAPPPHPPGGHQPVGGPARGTPVRSAAHDGTRDIGTPGQGQRVLLLRGIDQGTYVREVVRRVAEEIARMLGREFGVRDAETAIARVVMIVGRQVPLGWGFAFVELVTPELASALLPFLLSPQNQPNGFLISQVPVAPSFANPGAFVPVGSVGGQFTVRAAANGGIGSSTIERPDGEFCTYWHHDAGAVETVPHGAPAIPARGAPVVLSPETRAFLGTLAGVPGKESKESTPVTDAGSVGSASVASGALSTGTGGFGMQPIKIGISLGGGAGKKRKTEDEFLIPITTKNVLTDDTDEGDPGKDSVLLSRTKGAKIIPPTSTSRKVAKNINKWNTKQVELAKPAPLRDQPKQTPMSSANAIAIGERPQAPSTDAAATSTTADSFDYTDNSNFATTGKVACLLCQRQFKSDDMTNLADPAIREAGQRRKQSATATAATGSAEPKYRDRAAERREVHHQPDRPVLEPVRRGPPGAPGGGPKPPTAAAPPPPPPPAPVPAADTSNVGNQLLSRMGWTSGTGLGMSGEGRVEPIKVQQFEERAGLGAAKGREAGKWSGPGGWQERKKDLTKERYEAASGSGGAN